MIKSANYFQISHTNGKCSIIYSAVIQKHIAEIVESGVITYFSFLLLEIKFIKVLNKRYIAIIIQIIFVVLAENHNGINPPTCKIITTKNICKISCVTKIILNFGVKYHVACSGVFDLIIPLPHSIYHKNIGHDTTATPYIFCDLTYFLCFHIIERKLIDVQQCLFCFVCEKHGGNHMPIQLQLNHIAKSFQHGRKKVLRDVSLEAAGGECVGILGANGCGKSTLLSVLAGIQAPNSGSMRLNGQELYAGKGKRQPVSPIGYVPQECPLMEELNALDNLKLWYSDSPLKLEEELESGFLAMLGIPDFLKVSVSKMSGGMKKRLSIGCAVAGNPQVLLLDEPGAALDLICKERIEVYLKNFRKRGNIILIATHEEREISLCDRLFILREGMLVPFDFDGNIHHLAGKL